MFNIQFTCFTFCFDYLNFTSCKTNVSASFMNCLYLTRYFILCFVWSYVSGCVVHFVSGVYCIKISPLICLCSLFQRNSQAAMNEPPPPHIRTCAVTVTHDTSDITIRSVKHYWSSSHTWQQDDGTPMGSPISSILAEIFLQEVEKKFYPDIIKQWHINISLGVFQTVNCLHFEKHLVPKASRPHDVIINGKTLIH